MAKEEKSKWRNYVEYIYAVGMRPHTIYPSLLGKWLLDNVYKIPGKIADFGCGRGDYLDVFKSLGFTSFGLDISSSITNIKTHPVKQVDFTKDNPPYVEEKFDFVFSKSVIEHLHDPTPFLSGMYESLEPGGVAVVMTPSWAHTYWGPFYIDYTHVTPFTRYSLRAGMEMAGFKGVTVKCFYQLPFLWKYPFLTPLIKLISKIPFPYAPYNDVPWNPDSKFNKFVRFSKEPMLMAIGTRFE